MYKLFVSTSVWKSYIKIGYFLCPLSLYTAESAEIVAIEGDMKHI